ncbi:hypothetical protein [Paenibacillus kribbensis]|uniref:hypothetical protein n=1 Tax=Paenibacillus kribbensis TaxID=172713 RepID=UPI00159F071E|nr:hypothetical protein [Paenibacillus kribbensis]
MSSMELFQFAAKQLAYVSAPLLVFTAIMYSDRIIHEIFAIIKETRKALPR